MADATQAVFTVGMPTLAVLVGILINNSRLSDLKSYMDHGFDAMNQSMNQRFADMERVNEIRTHLILGKIEDIDKRLSRLEERFSH